MAKIVKKTEIQVLEEEVQRGNTLAYYNLGYIYLLGQQVKEDKEKAISYFRRGASHQDGKCMQALAMCYRNGDGVEVDLNKMVYWLKNGVKINDYGCMYQLALCYEKGEGVECDMNQAILLMQEASKKNRDARSWLKSHHQKSSNWIKRLFGGKK